MTHAVEFKDVSKKYKMYSQQSDRIKGIFSGKVGKDFYALQNVSFAAEKGEVIGIIGVNGAGKSTLSNLLSGITQPTSGEVVLNGQASLIAIASGLDGKLTGLENIEMKLLMLGFSKKQINEITPEIINFSELEDFINQPVKNYSSGMRSRLGFAISVNIDPEILIIDEALSVGDQTFTRKCLRKMNEFKERGKTIFLISHTLIQVRNWCQKVIWMEAGQVREYGSAKEIIPRYRAFLKEFNKLKPEQRKNFRQYLFEKRQKHENGQTFDSGKLLGDIDTNDTLQQTDTNTKQRAELRKKANRNVQTDKKRENKETQVSSGGANTKTQPVSKSATGNAQELKKKNANTNRDVQFEHSNIKNKATRNGQVPNIKRDENISSGTEFPKERSTDFNKIGSQTEQKNLNTVASENQIDKTDKDNANQGTNQPPNEELETGNKDLKTVPVVEKKSGTIKTVRTIGSGVLGSESRADKYRKKTRQKRIWFGAIVLLFVCTVAVVLFVNDGIGGADTKKADQNNNGTAKNVATDSNHTANSAKEDDNDSANGKDVYFVNVNNAHVRSEPNENASSIAVAAFGEPVLVKEKKKNTDDDVEWAHIFNGDLDGNGGWISSKLLDEKAKTLNDEQTANDIDKLIDFQPALSDAIPMIGKQKGEEEAFDYTEYQYKDNVVSGFTIKVSDSSREDLLGQLEEPQMEQPYILVYHGDKYDFIFKIRGDESIGILTVRNWQISVGNL